MPPLRLEDVDRQWKARASGAWKDDSTSSSTSLGPWAWKEWAGMQHDVGMQTWNQASSANNSWEDSCIVNSDA